MDNITVNIRGIYTTALTQLFLDSGYEIIYPSESIQARFNLPYRTNKYSKDITIYDRNDKQGVSVKIKEEVYKKLIKNDFNDFPLSIKSEPQILQLNSNFNVNDIYKGKVIKSSKRRDYSFVKLIPDEKFNSEDDIHRSKFTTNLGHLSFYLPEDEMGIFQVKSEDYGTHMPELEQNFTLAGDLLVLLPKADDVFISKKVNDTSERTRLVDIGKDLLKSKYFGIICRTAAKYASREEIEHEFQLLETKYRNVQDLISKMPNEIGRIYSNTKSLNLLFPYSFKTKLDDLREKIVKTIKYHHTIKSLSFNDNRMADYYAAAEELLNYSEDLIGHLQESHRKQIEEFYLKNYYERIQEGKWMDIDHVKLSGRTLHLRGGLIQSYNKDPKYNLRIELKRKFRKKRRYDGLELPIEKGDYAVSTFESGDWYYISKYFSSDNDLKGKYMNINTPIEMSNQKIHYIDLEIDVVEHQDGTREIIDMGKLDTIYELELISKNIYDKAIDVAKELKELSESESIG